MVDLAKGLGTPVRRLMRDVAGNTVMVFALAAPVILLMIGAALDFSRGADAQTKLQTALDAAVLTGAKMLAEGETRERKIRWAARDVFRVNIKDSAHLYGSRLRPVFEVDFVNSRLTATATAEMDGIFSSLSKAGPFDVAAYSEAGFSNLQIELALVLDTTASMSGQKISDLKKAAGKAVDLLIGSRASTASRSNVRIAIAPYAEAVSAGSYASMVSGGATTNCVTERFGTGGDTDESPSRSPVPADPRATCPSVSILPLTNDERRVENQIKALSTAGNTAGHIGLAWGYYLVSPQWASVWPSDSAPSAYGERNVMKSVGLMTDGIFNTYYHGESVQTGASAAKKSSEQAGRLCKSMKDDGIRVYSIAFDATAEAEKLMRDCASDADSYFTAKNGDQLVGSFEAIAEQIRDLRLTR